MRSILPSPKRVLLLALLAVAIFGLGAATALIVLGIQADRKALADAEAQDAAAVWMAAAESFEKLALADPFLLPPAPTGDAADVYWPAGAAGADDCRLQYRPRWFDDPAYERWPDVLREAARCKRLDDFVRAAALPELNAVNRLEAGHPQTDFFESYELFRAPEQALYSLLARAHERVVNGDLRNGERDARAVVSAGRQFVWSSPDMYGVYMGLSLMSAGLDHLREVFERRADRYRAAMAVAARDSLNGIARSWSRMLAVGQATSTFPSLLRYAVAAAENEGLPLGMRSTMVVFLGYGHVGHSVERLLGPDPRRGRALARFEKKTALQHAVTQARRGLGLSWSERRELATQWAM